MKIKSPLKDVQDSLFRQAFVSILLLGASCFGVGYGVYAFAGVLIGYSAAGLLGVVGLYLLARAWSRLALKPTVFLTRAINHITNDTVPEPSPDPATLTTGRAYFEQLATSLYDTSIQKSAVPSDTKTSTQYDIARISPTPYVIMTSDGVIKEISLSFSQYLNLQPAEVIGAQLNDTCKFFFSSEDTLESWLEFATNKAVSISRSWDRVKITLADDSIRQFDLAAHFSKDSSGGGEVMVVLFDHTAKYAQDDSGASFVAMAVHELRTPLTIMRGYIEVFEDELTDKLSTEQAEFMRNLTAQAQQLTSFVNNIQNLSRIQDNALELVLKQEAWGPCLNTTLDDLEVRARSRKRILIRDIPADLPLVAVDRSTISEVIVNIIENSIKYTHTDDPITIRTYLKDDVTVETTIEDHGVGIPDALIGHVFDKFYRSHRTSKSVGGTGLGLYISKSIVEAHGGQIWVKSKEGDGSTFGFTIPTYASVADQVQNNDNGDIIRGAHGWIKNHTLYRG